ARRGAQEQEGRSFYVGQPDVVATLREKPNGRECMVQVQDGDEARYRETLRARLATWPAPLTRAARQVPANNYGSREARCGPAAGPEDWALISVGGENDMPSIVVTIGRSQDRVEGCDAASAAPAPADTASRADKFEAALRLCLAVFEGASIDDAAQRFG